jgi:hypothetical protein
MVARGLRRRVGSKRQGTDIGKPTGGGVEQVAILASQAAGLDSDRLRQRSIQHPGELLQPRGVRTIAEADSDMQNPHLDGMHPGLSGDLRGPREPLPATSSRN